jgi:hypothetical protein
MGSTVSPYPVRWGVCSTSLVSEAWMTVTSEAHPSLATYSTRAPHYEPPKPYHAKCPYCGTHRKPFTYMNCINCGAPA